MRKTMSFDDDDDLESLRMAALQTLNNPIRKPASNPIQVLEPTALHHQPRYEEGMFARALPEAPFPAERVPERVFGTNGQWQSDYVPPYDVQLSPRSAAFVLQNTSILRQRKGDKSPSVTPPRIILRTPSPERPPTPVYRHRSPPSPKRFYSRSPILRRERSLTRSPPRSPPMRRRTRSRSPVVRRPSPRFIARSRNNSPRPPRSRRQSPRVSPVRRKASRSPVRVMRHRSQSPKRAKSPLRKPRRPREPLPIRRRTPERNVKRLNDRRPREPRDMRSDAKPCPRPRRRSPEKVSHTPAETKVTEKLEEFPEKDEINHEKDETFSSPEKDDEDAKSTECEDNADGIDLFASDESESENEGRFKSSSNRSERSTQPTVSFSKLVTDPLTELKDIPSLSSVGSGQRDRRERERERNNRDYNRNRRKRERDRRGGRRELPPRDSGKSKDTDKDSRTKLTNKGESNIKTMFKSTFQAVIVNDSKRQADPAPGDGGSEKMSKDEDKRKIIQIKKPISIKESKDKPDQEIMTNGGGSSSAAGGADGKVKKSIHLRLGGYATPNGESSSSLSGVLATSTKSLKSGNLTNLKKSWKTSEKV